MRDLSRFFRALGDETRLRLVALLARQEPGKAWCVGRLARELRVTPSAVSQHLRVLKDLGLARGERKSHRIHYFLDQERLAVYRNLARVQLGEGFLEQQELERQEEGTSMCCRDKNGCEHPEKKQGAEKCTPEQIRECHGEVQKHPCGCTPDRIQECHGEGQEHPCKHSH
jgi:DNA-binding transcriptional ArsR family regulator